MKALTVANYLLAQIPKEDYENGEGISNLKLQKLLFYIQKTYYSVHKKPLFDDNIEAWQHGPVVPKVYHNFKKYNADHINIIDLDDEIRADCELDYEAIKVVDFVKTKFMQYTAWHLRSISHEDKAWLDNYIPSCNNNISLEELEDEGLKKEFLEIEKLFDEF